MIDDILLYLIDLINFENIKKYSLLSKFIRNAVLKKYQKYIYIDKKIPDELIKERIEWVQSIRFTRSGLAKVLSLSCLISEKIKKISYLDLKELDWNEIYLILEKFPNLEETNSLVAFWGKWFITRKKYISLGRSSNISKRQIINGYEDENLVYCYAKNFLQDKGSHDDLETVCYPENFQYAIVPNIRTYIGYFPDTVYAIKKYPEITQVAKSFKLRSLVETTTIPLFKKYKTEFIIYMDLITMSEIVKRWRDFEKNIAHPGSEITVEKIDNLSDIAFLFKFFNRVRILKLSDKISEDPEFLNFLKIRRRKKLYIGEKIIKK